jgi:methionine-gamma-lyase
MEKEPKCIEHMLVRESVCNPWNAINVPVCFSSTYEFDDLEEAELTFSGMLPNFCYSRLGNPTVRAFEDKMTEIESGLGTVAFSSGMAAITAVILTVCKPGDMIMCVEEVYGGTHELLKSIVTDLDIKVITFKPDILDIPFTFTTKRRTRLIFVETPTNPSLHTVDLGGLMQIAGMFEDAYVCVDNTFATPIFQQPIYQCGADISLHSTTKYIGGHGDLIGGCATVGAVPRLLSKLQAVKTTTGAIMDPMTAFLNLRGLKTLALRMKQHTINALTLASLFDDLELKHIYPGFGGMVSLDLGSRENAKKFIEQLVGPTLAVSLGETQTLINVPALMTHAAYSNEELKAIGLGPGQIRISVGIEEPCKLRKEFKKALEGI